MKYVFLLSLLFVACGGPDAANNDTNSGAGGTVNFGGFNSGAVGGLCDPDAHCHTGGVGNPNGGSGNGGSANGGSGNVSNVGGTVASGGKVSTGGMVGSGGKVSSGGMHSSGGVVGTAGEGGSAGDNSDAGAGGTCHNSCDDDYLVCKSKCYTKQCSYSVRYQCLCDCKTVYEKCVKTSSCDTVTHTCH
jgi:hypothetical protein